MFIRNKYIARLMMELRKKERRKRGEYDEAFKFRTETHDVFVNNFHEIMKTIIIIKTLTFLRKL